MSGGHGLGSVEPIAETRTVEQLMASALRESILDGRLEPGVRLPYRDLARQFNASVTPVRIALRELMTEGLVEFKAHGGATVASLSIEELEELFLMRSALESWMAFLSIPKLRDEDVERLKEDLQLSASAASGRDPAKYLSQTFELRSVCYRAAERPRLLQRTNALYKRSTRYNLLILEDFHRLDQSFRFNADFVERCEARDSAGARTIVRETLEWSMTVLSEALREHLR